MLSDDAYFAGPMLPITYYSWERDLFFFNDRGILYRSCWLYPITIESVTYAKFAAATQGAEIVATPKILTLLERLQQSETAAAHTDPTEP